MFRSSEFLKTFSSLKNATNNSSFLPPGKEPIKPSLKDLAFCDRFGRVSPCETDVVFAMQKPKGDSITRSLNMLIKDPKGDISAEFAKRLAQMQEASIVSPALRASATLLKSALQNTDEVLLPTKKGSSYVAFSELNGPSQFARLRSYGRAKEAASNYTDNVKIISGICLFGAGGLTCISADGTEYALCKPGTRIEKSIEVVTSEANLSLYEVEAAVRLSAAITSIVKGANKVNGIAIQIPREEYYLYALPALLEGFINRQQYRDIIDRIDQRSAELQRTVTSFLPSYLKVEFPKPLASVRGLLCEAPFSCEGIAFCAIGDALAAQNDTFAMVRNKFLKELKPEQTVSLGSLNFLGYMQLYLEACLDSSGRLASCLAIENSSEEGIIAGIERLNLDKELRRLYAINAIYLPSKLLLQVGNDEITIADLASDACDENAVLQKERKLRVAVCEEAFFSNQQSSVALMPTLQALYLSGGGQ